MLGVNENLYDSVVLTKDTGSIRGLPIDGDIEKQRKTELINMESRKGNFFSNIYQNRS